MGTVPPFGELIAATTSSAVHLEMRDSYTPSDPQFQDWQAGRPRPVPASRAWYDLVREHTARGVRFRRARVVSEPVSDYIRFEYEATAGLNVAAGEEVRWLPRRRASDLCLPATTSGCSTTGGSGSITSPATGGSSRTSCATILRSSRMCAAAFEAVWERAVPHADYRLA